MGIGEGCQPKKRGAQGPLGPFAGRFAPVRWARWARLLGPLGPFAGPVGPVVWEGWGGVAPGAWRRGQCFLGAQVGGSVAVEQTRPGSQKTTVMTNSSLPSLGRQVCIGWLMMQGTPEASVSSGKKPHWAPTGAGSQMARWAA